MGRERREFKRTSGFRDASLIVIATEGEKSEPNYFEYLTESEGFVNPKVHIKLIPSIDGKSAPKHVLNNLNEFKKEFRIRETDELWMVIDRDFKSWTQAQLSLCLKECKQKSINLALSNPCFEIWVLLHFLCIHSQTDEYKEDILQNLKANNKTFCEREILKIRGHYNKSSHDFSDLIPKTQLAIERVLELTNNNTKNLFDEIGSDLNILVSKLVNAI